MAEAKTTWTEELKADVIEDYKNSNPTAENTVEITKELADQYNTSVNAVRLILMQSGVYVKKGTDAKSATAKPASTRVSKADAIQALVTELEKCGDVDIDQEIIEKLTGKAAVYFASVIKSINKAV